MRYYVILGYGVPKDIHTDGNYDRYLSYVFNTIWEEARGEKITIIFSGGRTDLTTPPYSRSEAYVMHTFFEALCCRDPVAEATDGWLMVQESSAISLIENLLFTRALFLRRAPEVENITIFCEYTRLERVHGLAKKVFGRVHTRFHDVDFDLSVNRYRGAPSTVQVLLGKVEELVLKDPDRWLPLHHAYHAKRLEFLRQSAKPGPEAVREWSETKAQELLEQLTPKE